MFQDILLWSIFGVIVGVVSGILPGIHVNLVSALTLSFSPFLLLYSSPLSLVCFLLSLAITHTFLDVIPTTFLGIPDPESGFLLFPSQKLVLQGQAYQAVFLSTYGALFGLILSFLSLPLLLFLTEKLYPPLEAFIGWILLSLCVFLLFREKQWHSACCIFFLSGTLGMVVFSLPLEEGLFPLFSGLFGVSALLLSLRSHTCIPAQEKCIPEIEQGGKAVCAATIMGWFASFMPGIGPAQAASVGSLFFRLENKGYMILTGGLSTVNTLLALLSFYLFEKTRSGVLVNIATLVQLDSYSFLLLLCIALFAGGIGAFLTLQLCSFSHSLIEKIDYFSLTIFIITFIVGLVFLLTGTLGILILAVSTSVGLLTEIQGVAKSHMMGCLLLPVLLFFLL